MDKITRTLIYAARTGNIRTAATLINCHGLSHKPEWQNGYTFYEMAVKYKQTAFVEFLISRGCPTRKNVNTFNNSPLHFAVRNKNIENAELLLRQGANVNSQDENGNTPLAIAVFEGYLEIVELLLDYRADINAKVQDLSSPLHIACRFNFGEIAKLLLNRGADANIRAIDENREIIIGGDTPLHLSAQSGNSELVRLLLEHGADFHYLNQRGKTALFLAVEKGDVPVVEEILKCPNHIPSDEFCLVEALTRRGENYGKIVLALLDHGFTIRPESAWSAQLLRGSVEKGIVKIVECLLKPEFGVNLRCWPFDALFLLHIAVQNKYEEVARLLIKHKANVNASDRDGRPPIFYAVDNVDLRMTQLLLSYGAKVRDFPEVFHAAVHRNSVEIAELLSPHGVDVNVDVFGKNSLHYVYRNEDRSYRPSGSRFGYAEELQSCRDCLDLTNVKALISPLHVAIEKGYASMVDLLLRQNASVNAADKLGLTPLHLSARRGSLDICKMLLNKGASVNARNGEGDTALHLAVCNIHEEVVKLLIESGAQVDIQLNDGKASLHLAAARGNPGIIVALLKSGANVDSRCKKGKTPLHYSCEIGDAKNVETLLDYGADMGMKSDELATPFDLAENVCRYVANEIKFKFLDIMGLLHRHKVKAEVAGLNRWDEFLYLSRDNTPLPDFQSDCELELAIMTSELIDGTYVSYHDILVKDTRYLAKYMNNENIIMAAKREEYKEIFPIYAGILEAQFQKGLTRNRLLEQATQAFRRLFDLPKDCSEKIMEYLSVTDLRALMAVQSLQPVRG